MNILKLVDFNEIGYNMMVGVYSFLATIYNMLMELTYDTDFTRILDKDITTYTQPMYVLAGIFMLFRLSVSFLNYIIDPDKISDNQSGPTNILTRVIVSIVLLMLLTPSGVVYDYLGRLQNTILTSGVLERITGSTLTTQNNLYVNPMEKSIEQVDAASTKKCYYYSRMSENKIKGFYKLEVSSKKFSGATKLDRKSFLGTKTLYVKFSNGSETYTSTEGSKTLTAKVGFQTLKNITSGGYSDASTCPQFIEIHDNSAKLCKRNDTSCGVVTLSTGWGGYSSLEKMLKDIANKNYNLQSAEGYKVEDSNSSGVQEVIDDMESQIPEWRENQSTLGTENEAAINFTKAIGSSFLTCAEGTDEYDDCKKAVDEKMFTVKGDQEIIELLNNDAKPLSFSFLPSLLVGIIVIVFMITLCVDVVVRAFKLLMLQILAPIPIINRIDPKDKMFDSWLKMYLSTYADLFIKLVAINFGIIFLNLALELELSGLQKVFYVLGILVFIKAVPDMISNIFGIKLAAGTFKDSMNMVKKGIGIGTGAALLFGAGVPGMAVKMAGTKGQSFGNKMLAGAKAFGDLVGGTLSGAAAGSKGIGNAARFAKSNFSKDWNKGQLYKAGFTEADLMAGAFAGGALGYAARVDRANKEGKEKAETLEKFTKLKGAIEDTAESGKFMKTLRQNVATGKLNLDENTMQDYRDTWVEYQIQSKANKEGLAEAFGKVSNTISARQELKTTLESRVSAGEITQAQMKASLKEYDVSAINNFSTNEERIAYNTSMIEQETGIRIGEEAGKQAGIVSTMTQAKSTLAGSQTVRDVAGVDDVTSFADLKDANTKVKKEATRINDEIYATEATDKYQISKAAQEVNKDKK